MFRYYFIGTCKWISLNLSIQSIYFVSSTGIFRPDMPLARMASTWTEILDKIILHSHLASGGFLHCNNKMALIFHRHKKNFCVETCCFRNTACIRRFGSHIWNHRKLVLFEIYWSKARTIILVEWLMKHLHVHIFVVVPSHAMCLMVMFNNLMWD
jgi:hypothetical protein